MKPRIQSAIFSLVILGAGIALGFWLAERPLPPLGVLGGPGSGSRPGSGAETPPRPHLTAAQRDALDHGLAALQPQVEAFQQGFTSLDKAYRARFDAILTDAQRARVTPHNEIDWVSDFNLLARSRVGEATVDGLPGAQDDPEHSRLLFTTILRIVMYEPSLRIATDKYQLDPGQQAQLRAAMEERRQAFLRLSQENPLPVDRIYVLLRDLGLLPTPRPPGPEAAAPAAPAAP